MTVRNLDSLFKPRTIAFIGSRREPLDQLLVHNLLNAGFAGPVMPVDPTRQALAGVLTYADVASLPLAPDLAVIAAPLAAVPPLLSQLGERGARAAVILSDDDQAADPAQRRARHQALLDAAQPYLLRLVGPDCLGLSVPAVGLNASLSQFQGRGGPIAFITHSGAIARAALDWGEHLGVGFSHLVSLGEAIDVDIADLLDYLASDLNSRAILLYLEQIQNPRKFLSAARRVARIKPVIALKPRRAPGAAGDAVYEAAFRRAGILRVNDRHELFTLVETLTASKPVSNDRLAILSNSRSFSLLAVDTLEHYGGRLAPLAEETQQALRLLCAAAGLPGGNPVDLGDLADADRYGQALDLLLKDRAVDGVLVINAPNPLHDPLPLAEVLSQRQPRTPRCLIACFAGPQAGQAARHRTMQQRIPSYETADEAVRAFMRLVQHKRNQELLMETPPSIPASFTPDLARARQVLDTALAQGREQLTQTEAMALLLAYGIPVVDFHYAADPAAAAELAGRLGRPVALKVLSPDITDAYRAGGVLRYLESPLVVQEAATAMLARLRQALPEARFDGLLLQPIEYRGNAYEITLGVRPGGPFGPVIFFGQGGSEAAIIGDIAYGLPPLNLNLACEMMAQTRLYAELRDNPLRGADRQALALTLLKVAQMVIDFGEIAELEINPLRASTTGVVALDAQVRLAPFAGRPAQRLAIRPYPKELEERCQLPDGRELLLRPILPEDEPALQDLVRRTPAEDLRMRFFQPIRELSHSMAARLAQIDYNREMALIVSEPDRPPGQATIYGVVRLNAEPNQERAEYAILIDRQMTGLGLGPMLMRRIIRYGRDQGLREIYGEVLRENEPMLRINQALGFQLERRSDDPEIIHVTLAL